VESRSRHSRGGGAKAAGENPGGKNAKDCPPSYRKIGKERREGMGFKFLRTSHLRLKSKKTRLKKKRHYTILG